MFKKIIKKLSQVLRVFYVRFRRVFFKHNVRSNFIIIDDFFPNPLSDWRLKEFNYYLETIPNTKILRIGTKSTQNYFKNKAKNVLENYLTNFPNNRNKIVDLKDYSVLKANLGYCLFYNNLVIAFPYFNKYNIPFIITLYPGGGLRVYDSSFDLKLKGYLNSSLCQKIIVNMPFIHEYLVDYLGIDSNKVELIYGVPIDPPVLLKKQFFKTDKIKVLFSSHKYMEFGLDKGFDVFCRVAKELENNNDFEFTVAGGFTIEDLILPTKNIFFLKEMSIDDLHQLSTEHNIILSPNRSFVLSKGAFDGFPTGSVMHAGLCGCLMMVTDDFDNAFKIGMHNNVDFIKISTNPKDIASKLLELKDNKNNIISIAEAGRNKLLELLELDKQLVKRLEIIMHSINKK